ncbi:MAG: hypothetical protein KAU27_02820 [Desulfuromonadales bacterium]|nr:hypothetical protein [Desulfuromonadales bacterium]
MCPVRNSALQYASSVRAILVRSLCFATVFILTATPLYAIAQDSIRSSVFALDSARQTALHELEATALSAREVTDYRDFIIYLNTRIINYCQELAEQGDLAALEGLPCPSSLNSSSAETASAFSEGTVFYTTGADAAEAQTQAEKSAELDGDFLSTLGEFDEMLLKEEDKLAARVPSQRESASAGSSGGSGSDGNGGSDGEGGESGSEAAGETAEQGEGDAVADGQEGTESGTRSGVGAGNADVDHSVYGAPGGKLPPPEDDDIVARQLREAAEKEPDPELKKKLWEEYWKYKGVGK